MNQQNPFFEPQDDSTIHFTLTEGAKIRILKREGRWYKIDRLDGKRGWVPKEFIESIQIYL